MLQGAHVHLVRQRLYWLDNVVQGQTLNRPGGFNIAINKGSFQGTSRNRLFGLHSFKERAES